MKQLLALSFFARYPGWWTFNKSERRTILALEKKGFLEVSGDQARFTGKTC